jgi:hypothetical protein
MKRRAEAILDHFGHGECQIARADQQPQADLESHHGVSLRAVLPETTVGAKWGLVGALEFLSKNGERPRQAPQSATEFGAKSRVLRRV